MIMESQYLAAAQAAGPMAVHGMQQQQLMAAQQQQGSLADQKKQGGGDKDLAPVDNPMAANPQMAAQPQNPMMAA